MQTERQREAAELRAQGSQRNQEIRARADRDVTVLIAEAQQRADQTRGEGDAERNRVFAEAYGKDPDFFAFYRSMQAYEAGLRANDTRLVLRPDSDFFRFFGAPGGKAAEPKPEASSQASSEPKSEAQSEAKAEPKKVEAEAQSR
jgi:modulator of FtsH protease HflC